jgi:outer membrane protein assembly factor BamB
MKPHSALAAALLAGTSLLAAPPDPKPGVDWPSFRGIRGAGVADGFTAAVSWSVPDGKGVRWKTPIAGLGHSSPIVWGGRVCVTTAISGSRDAGIKIGLYGDITSIVDDTSHTWQLICVDKRTGRVAVERTIHTGVPVIKRHLKSTHANTTLATDGTAIVAMLGSEGLYAYSMDGTLKWKKDLGVLDSGYYVVPSAQWEFASSPVIHAGVVVVQADVQKDSFLAAFDLASGRELWRTSRSDVPTFSTPTIHEVGGKTQVIVNGWRHIGAYDFATGREIWRINGAAQQKAGAPMQCNGVCGGDIPVPVPIVGDGLVFITNAHGPGAPVYAIREGATGDISLDVGATTNTGVAWSTPREGAYMISPVLYDGLLYVSKNNGVISAFEAKSGERIYQQRLGNGTTGFTASLVAADGKIYATSEEGDVYVIKAGRTFELLATNPLGDIAMATPAVSEGALYFRTGTQLIAVGR